MNKVTALLILLIGLLQYKLWFGDGNVLEFQRLNDRIAELRQEGAKRRERNAALEAEVMDLKQGLDAVEERARHELGMIMDGEEFVQVIDPQHEPELSVSPAPVKSTITDEVPEVAKNTKKEKPQQKKKPKEAETSKSKESKNTSNKKSEGEISTKQTSAKKPTTDAKKPITDANTKSTTTEAATKKTPPKPKVVAPKPVEVPKPPPKKPDQPPAKALEPLF